MRVPAFSAFPRRIPQLSQTVNGLRERTRNTLYSTLAGRKVPEFLRDDIRELIEENYRIVYKIFEDRLVILTVFEGHQLYFL